MVYSLRFRLSKSNPARLALAVGDRKRNLLSNGYITVLAVVLRIEM